MFTTIYEKDSFAPVAILVWLKDELGASANDETAYKDNDFYNDDPPKPTPKIQVFHYHNDQLGTPNELTTNDGEVIWVADY